MCGIAGAVGAIDERVIEAVGAATAALVHRGPDQGGAWDKIDAARGIGVAVGHRRLSILDLSEAGRQPMVGPNGRVVVFNGEIFNYGDLRRELRARGYEFVGGSDTEVLLAAWDAWGPAAVERFRGMFAFAIYDPEREQLHLVRDRLGKKPLYVARVERRGKSVLLFASEVRALLATGLVPRELDPEGLASYLWQGFVAGPATIVRGIRLVPPATALTFALDGRELDARRYWSLPRARSTVRDPVDALAVELEQAVALRLVSDVPLGVFLSGGVDSSAVSALAWKSAGADLRTFCIGFDDVPLDESRYAAEVAAELGTRHETIILTEDRFESVLPDALDALDQPTFDAINTYLVSRVVREAGVTVALAGTGGDELFGGYRSFRDIVPARLFGQVAGILPPAAIELLAEAASRAAYGPDAGSTGQTRWAKVGDLAKARGGLVDTYQSAYSLFTRRALDRLAIGRYPLAGTAGLDAERREELLALVRGEPSLHAISLLELSLFLGDRLLRDTDTASMAVSLEVRTPLLDHRIVEAVAAVGALRRFFPLGKKTLLRELALGVIDPAVFDRPKSGFVLPIQRWARQRLSGELERTFADDAALARIGVAGREARALWGAFREGKKGTYWSRPWALFVLARWCERHDVHL